MNRFIKVICVLAVVGLVAATPAWAATRNWTNAAANQLFVNPSNWSDTTPFDVTDVFTIDKSLSSNSPIINLGDTISCNSIFLGTTAPGKLTINGGDVTIDSTFRVGGVDGESWVYFNDGTITKNAGAGSVSTRFGWGTADGDTGNIGHLEMTGGATFNNTGNLLFGYLAGNTGYLNMVYGGNLSSGGGTTTIGFNGVGQINMTANAVFTQRDGEVRLGYSGGTANVVCDDGYITTNGGLRLGYQGAGATGNVTLKSGGNITYGNFITVGDSEELGTATGSITMKDWSKIYGTGNIYVGFRSASTGTIDMSGTSGIEMNGAEMFIGIQDGNFPITGTAQGNLKMMDNAYITNYTGNVILGRGAQTTSNTVMGVKGGVDTAYIASNILTVGNDSSNSTLVMNAGTHIDVGFWQNIGCGGTGTVTLNDYAQFNVTGQGNVNGGGWSAVGNNGNGTIVLNDSSEFHAGNCPWFILGVNGRASITVNNSALLERTQGELTLGYPGWTSGTGYGELIINGGTANLAYLGAGFDAGYTAVVAVHTGGTLNITGMDMGRSSCGLATLTVDGGTLVSTGDETIGRDQGTTAVGNLSAGSITQSGGWFMVGANNGVGTLNVSDTGALDVQNGYLFLGRGGNSHGTGIVNQTGGTVKNTGLLLGEGASTATYNLQGGVLTTPFVQAGWGWGEAVTSTLNLDGGTLVATRNEPNFIYAHGATGFQGIVGPNGAVIDSNGFNVGVNAVLQGTGGPGLTKNGAGMMTFNGKNTYTSPTVVNAGGITVASTGGLATSSITLTAAGTSVFAEIGSLANVAPMEALILPNTSTVGIALTSSAADVNAFRATAATGLGGVLNLAGGTGTVDLAVTAPGRGFGVGPGVVTPQVYTVFGFNSIVGNLTNLNVTFPAGSRATLTPILTPNSIQLSIVQNSMDLTWRDSASSNWDNTSTTDLNWLDAVPTPQNFRDYDVVHFTDVAVNNRFISVVGTVHPVDIYVNSTGDYTIDATGADTGAITGIGTTLTKSNTGTLNIGPNVGLNFTGLVTANAGTVNFNRSWVMGNGGSQDLTINGGTVNVTGHLYGAFNTGAATTITMTAGTLNTGTATPEWTQLGSSPLSTINIALSGSSVFANSEPIGICYGGGTGTVTMSGSSQLTSTQEIRLGAGGNLNTTLSGTASITNTAGNFHIGLWGPGTSTVTLNSGTSINANGSELFMGNQGGHAVLNMKTGSKLNVAGYANIGRGGEAVINMEGTAAMNVGQDLRIGRYDGGIGGTLNMKDTATATANAFASGADGCTGTTNLGTLGGTDTPAITSANWVNIGDFGGSTGTVNVQGNATLTAGGLGWSAIGSFNGNGTLNLADNAKFTINNGDYWATMVATCQWNGYNGTTHRATVNMNGNSQLVDRVGWLAGCIWGGIDGNQQAHFVMNMSGNSQATLGFISLGDGANGDNNGNKVTDGILNVTDHAVFATAINTGLNFSRDANNVPNGVTSGDISVGSGGPFNGYGEINLSGNGKVISAHGIYVGNQNGKSVINVTDSGSLSAATDVRIGLWGGVAGSNNRIVVDGGATGTPTFTVGGTCYVGWQWGGNNLTERGNQTVTISGNGAVVNLNGADRAVQNTDPALSYLTGVDGSLVLGSRGGQGVWNQNGGVTTVANTVVLGQYDITEWVQGSVGGGGDGYLSLNGGTFIAKGFSTQASPDATNVPAYGGNARGTVNFNGGTLKLTASNANLFATSGLDAAVTLNVLAGNAKIDTDGHNVKITQAISGVGGVDKLGDGNLTLAGKVTLPGVSSVATGGRLAIDNGLADNVLGTITGAGTLSVGNSMPDTVVSATSIQVDTLQIGSGFYTEAYAAQAAAVLTTGPSFQVTKGVSSTYLGGPAALPGTGSVTPVPEPSTIVLLVLAGLGALLTLRRK